MSVSVSDLKKYVDCGNATDEMSESNLKAIESVIRAYTNNNFQMRTARFLGNSAGMRVYGVPQFISLGDTIQISGTDVNDGLYVVGEVGSDYIQLDQYLQTVEDNIVTKVKYPYDVMQCAIDLYKWKQTMGAKVGIKSETLSRHSVTYEDSATLFMGYPVGILNGLNLYKKARC